MFVGNKRQKTFKHFEYEREGTNEETDQTLQDDEQQWNEFGAGDNEPLEVPDIFVLVHLGEIVTIDEWERKAVQ